jgi:methyl-accepting chemotaxis protein
MLKRLNRVFTRILLLAGLALGSLAVVGYVVIEQSRDNLFEQKKNEVKHLVEAAVTIVVDADKRAQKGEITLEEAQAFAKRAIGGMRFGNNDYVFAYDFRGTMLVNPMKSELVGTNRFDERDPNGKYFIREFIEKAKAGGGHVFYVYQLPQSNTYKPKFSYASGYVPWGWMIACGLIVDDVEAMYQATLQKVLICIGVTAGILLLGVLLLTRSIVGPLGRLTGSLERLAGGDIEADVAGAQRSDEFGTIARAAIGVREAVRIRASDQMQREEDGKRKAETERRALLTELATSLDRQVKAVAESVDSAAQELLKTAHSMQSVSQGARRGRQGFAGQQGRDGSCGDRRHRDFAARRRGRRDRLARSGIVQDFAGRRDANPRSRRHRAHAVRGVGRNRQSRGTDPGDRRADQPAGAQCHD